MSLLSVLNNIMSNFDQNNYTISIIIEHTQSAISQQFLDHPFKVIDAS